MPTLYWKIKYLISGNAEKPFEKFSHPPPPYHSVQLRSHNVLVLTILITFRFDREVYIGERHPLRVRG